jgi:ABC-type phosphate transport system permease subunit
MYIGIGTVVVILLILLVIFLLRRLCPQACPIPIGRMDSHSATKGWHGRGPDPGEGPVPGRPDRRKPGPGGTAGVIGSTIGGAVVSLVALTVSVPVAVATLAFYIAYRLAEDYLIVPRAMGRTVQGRRLSAWSRC